jgi:signal transduction histidine kinase
VLVRIVSQMRQQRVELQEANRKLVLYANTLEQLTESRERNRIARELHDTLTHTLSSVAVQLEGVKSLWESDPETSRSMLEQSLAVTRSGLTETRKAIQALRASPLDDLGIHLALRELAHTAAERGGFEVRLDFPDRLGEISQQQETCIYRVTQEGLENIVRHAMATQVTICLRKEGDSLALTIEDDGIGFEPEAAGQEGHFGLRGLYERAEMAEGQLSIESEGGKGTRLRLEFKRHD